MKRFLSLVLCMLLSIQYSAFSDEKQSLIIATSADNPPYEFIQYGNITGFDIELVDLICKRLNMPYKIEDVPSDRLFKFIKAKKCDMAIAQIGMSHPEGFGVDFSIPYLTSTKAIVMVNTGEFGNVPQGAYLPLSLLKDKEIGVLIGSQDEEMLYESGVEKLKIRRYESLKKLSEAMSKSTSRKGILYGIMVEISDAKSIVQKDPKLIFYRVKLGNSLVIAFPKDSPLLGKVNKIITNLINEGRIAKLIAKWGIGCD